MINDDITEDYFPLKIRSVTISSCPPCPDHILFHRDKFLISETEHYY